MINYPNGKKPVEQEKQKHSAINHSNRGMQLESDINASIEYYMERGIAVITKRPTPINVVKVDYTRGARIIDAYFEKQSTTDYNGVYKGRYIDFEAKSTLSKTSFPLHNITMHQIIHLQRVHAQGGITFFVIAFEKLSKVYLLDGQFVIDFYLNGDRKSIPLALIKENATEICQGFMPRLQLIEAINEVYFHEKIPESIK